MHNPLCLQLISIMEMHVTYYKGVIDFDPKPHPKAWNQGCVFLESQKTLPGTQVLNMNALW